MQSRTLLGVLLLFAAVTTARAQTPPPNDNFTNAILLSGNQVSFSGTLSNATLENWETFPITYPYEGLRSVWWKWTPVSPGPVLLQITPDNPGGGRVDAGLQIYRGADVYPPYPNYLEYINRTTLDIPAGRFAIQSLYVPTNGFYFFRISGNWQGTFNVQLTASPQPVILQQPGDQTASPYGSAMFSALATGIPAPVYQWLFNGTPLPGQTASILLLHDLQTNATGRYSVIASNTGGSTESASAWLTVRATNPVPRVTMLGPTNGSRVYFLVEGEPGRYYRFLTTDDVNDWLYASPPPISAYGQATNVKTLYSSYLLNPQKQFIAVALDAANDGCVAQLQAFHSALTFYTLENNLRPIDVYQMEDLLPYFRNGIFQRGISAGCPGNGAYTPGNVLTNDPTCSLGHFLGIYGHHWP